MTPAPKKSRPGKFVSDSQHETSEIMMPQHANNLGHVFGGVILSMMDRTAAVAAIRHARGSCVTVSVDRVDFREPIHLGDLVIMKASVNYTGPHFNGDRRARGLREPRGRRAASHEFVLSHVRGGGPQRPPGGRAGRDPADATTRSAATPRPKRAAGAASRSATPRGSRREPPGSTALHRRASEQHAAARAADREGHHHVLSGVEGPRGGIRGVRRERDRRPARPAGRRGRGGGPALGR